MRQQSAKLINSQVASRVGLIVLMAAHASCLHIVNIGLLSVRTANKLLDWTKIGCFMRPNGCDLLMFKIITSSQRRSLTNDQPPNATAFSICKAINSVRDEPASGHVPGTIARWLGSDTGILL